MSSYRLRSRPLIDKCSFLGCQCVARSFPDRVVRVIQKDILKPDIPIYADGILQPHKPCDSPNRIVQDIFLPVQQVVPVLSNPFGAVNDRVFIFEHQHHS